MYIEMYTLWFSCDCNIMRNALSKNLERKSSSLLPFSTIQQPLGYTTHFWTRLQVAHWEFLNLRGVKFRGHINLHHDLTQKHRVCHPNGHATAS